MFKLFVFASVICCVFGLDLPSNFKKCKRNDSNFNNCLKVAIQDALPKLQNGLPDFNMPSLQPFEISSMTIGGGEGPVSVVQKFKNVKLYDVPLAVIDKVEVKLDSNTFNLVIEGILPEIKVEAEYNFDGKILLVPIKGDGAAHSVFSKVKIRLDSNGDISETNGERYASIKTVTVNLDPEKITFKFDNLFNGDVRLGNEMNALLNDNWKDIWNDVKSGYEEVLGVIIKDSTNKLFSKVPTSLLFPV